MSEALHSQIASERCQRARGDEWADTLPALFRSEGFFEDLAGEPVPAPRTHRIAPRSPGRQWAGVFVAALGLRRA